ncbi:MAG: hypothetical protein KDD85_09335 [Parvularculaceae bacterium]|nr:hypothetical protein [Parvularculaceae bacterium]
MLNAGTTTIEALACPIDLRDWIASARGGLFNDLCKLAPWEITQRAEAILRRAIGGLSGYTVSDGVAVHRTATVEQSVRIKSPAIISPNALVASGSYLRGGVFVDEGCVVGPNCEIKSSYLLDRSKVAHLSFIGDSIIGAEANIEAGVVMANFRNECEDKRIRIMFDGQIIDTGAEKFGALIGDRAKIGANAVIAPGALVRPGEIVPRLSLVDQSPPAA